MSDSPLVLQRRILTPFLSKKVPPLTDDSERVVYPESWRSPISKIYFYWLIPLLKVGYKRTLQPEDLYKLTNEQTVEYMSEVFMGHYNYYLPIYKKKFLEEKCKERNETLETSSVDEEEDLEDFEVPKIMTIKCLLLTYKRQYFFACCCVLFSSLSQCLSPLLTKELIKYVQLRTLGLEDDAGKGIGYSIGAIALVLLSGLLINHGFYKGMMTGAQMKAVLTKVILEKSFKLNPKSRHVYPSSTITSMMGTDTSRVDFAAGFQPFLITFLGPLITIIVVLIVNIGVSALVGIGLLFVFLFIIAVLSKRLFALRASATKFTDLRVNYIKEVLNNLKIIKFYSWEEAYHKNISDVRTKEMKIIYYIQVLRNVITSFAINLAPFASMVSFLVLYGIGSSKRNAANIFSSISLFNVFTSLVFMIPLAISSLSDAMIGISRIGNFLAAEEIGIEEGRVDAAPEVIEDMNRDGLALKISKASFEWEVFEQDDDEAAEVDEKQAKKDKKKAEKEKKKKLKELKKAKKTVEKVEDSPKEKYLTESESSSLDAKKFSGLNEIDIDVKKGEFIVITGLIGSGKSSLLNAISGFMKKSSGEVDINGSLILCGQPWIQNTTVKENILFGNEFDEQRYKDVIYACSLESDLEILPAGDRTEIGERGITLSGGQKARINLARSVYAESDIILLDDVLSAVDARVGKHIMQSCFMGLLKDKTRILATHQLSLIGSADRIIFLNGDGSIAVGTSDELQQSNAGFKSLMEFNTHTENDEEEEEEEAEEEHQEELELIKKQLTRASTKAEVIDEEAIHRKYNEDNDISGKLSDDENKAVNGVGLQVYLRYVRFGGKFMREYILLPVLIIMAVATFLTLFTNTWLSFWTEYKFSNRSDGFYIGIYVMFTILSLFGLMMLFIVIGYVSNQASRQLNIEAITKVLYSPMSFLDTTPMGRILNRFTKDTDVLDNELPDQLRFFTFSVAIIIGIMILCIIYLPWFAIAVPPFFGGAIILAEFYQSSAREIKRLEAVQRSFVYNNFNEILVGMNTIKAYKSERRFVQKNDEYINKMNEAYYITIAAQRFVGLNLELMACSLPLVVTFLSVFRVFNVSPASVGLLVSYVIQITGQMAFLVRSYTQVEMGMNSTERLCDFAFDLPQEAPYEIPENKPPSDWPQKGGIQFDHASLAYRPGLPLVLKDLEFEVKPQQKIGICGRTGAGKSSIMTALYRLAELESGSVFIDGVDISKIGLKDLRTKLSIIPQDPVLFRGSIRKNLDPFGQSPDDKLWDALRRAGLIEELQLQAIKNQDKENSNLHKFHLSQSVEDEGSNFSLGERQLIALARALVRDSKILILDEATSSVDYETDAKIQATIAKEFSDCTILCIAHRLKTIIDYDKILVLDRGAIKEFDSPWNLFNLKDGIFSQMCAKSKIQETDFTRK